ncbi:MAG: hypothetical protein GY722_21680, partial [bacterium]|nr:hypothetical protein [bacterium]
ESTGRRRVIEEEANQDWVELIAAVDGSRFERLARRYYLALYHFRKMQQRPTHPGRTQIHAGSRQQAFEGMLATMEQRKAERKQSGRPPSADEVFVDPDAYRKTAQDLPHALADFSIEPPALSLFLGGRGRPPCDALCMLRAFVAAPLLGVGDGPGAVYRLLRSNPTLADLCGFLGPRVLVQAGELTSRRLPSLSVCEEFTEVMTRYGLWHRARIEQVEHNIETGVVRIENMAAFDTTHLIANSHCGNVVPPSAEVDDGKKPKHRKVVRIRKHCRCGQANWERCAHAWAPTDQGAAVVVKGPTRVYWAHKAGIAAFADSEIPFDGRICLYAAEHDGKTLGPHLEILQRILPRTLETLRYALADDAYHCSRDEVLRFGEKARLVVPIKSRKARAGLAEEYGMDRFTPTGVPVCEAGHRFNFRGRDLSRERFIWAAPNDERGRAVCSACPLARHCLSNGQRRHLRVPRHEQPQIDWEHPQHAARERARYAKRPGVERAIKRLKIDLHGATLTHRDAFRVQAHLDRKLLVLHIMLEILDSG